jgi:hypothetical protein
MIASEQIRDGKFHRASQNAFNSLRGSKKSARLAMQHAAGLSSGLRAEYKFKTYISAQDAASRSSLVDGARRELVVGHAKFN